PHSRYLPCYSRVSLVWCSLRIAGAAAPAAYTLSLHDALPICLRFLSRALRIGECLCPHFSSHEMIRQFFKMSIERCAIHLLHSQDRKSTRLNSSHGSISYAVFCLQLQT